MTSRAENQGNLRIVQDIGNIGKESQTPGPGGPSSLRVRGEGSSPRVYNNWGQGAGIPKIIK